MKMKLIWSLCEEYALSVEDSLLSNHFLTVDAYEAGFKKAKELAIKDLCRVFNDDHAAEIVAKVGEEEV